MQRRKHAFARGTAAAAGVASLLLGPGYLAAQTPTPNPGPVQSQTGGLAVPPPPEDESGRLFRSPKGDIFRLTQTEGDPRAGGGGLVVSALQSPDTWKTLYEVRPAGPGITIKDADLAVADGGDMALVYRWWRFSPRSKQLRLAFSGDGGKTWAQRTEQLDGSGTAFDPKVAWARGKALVVTWTDERRGRRLFDIYARRSPDGGATWEPEQLLSRFQQNGPTDLYARPTLLSDGGDRLWSIWVGLRGTRSVLYLNRSTDGGKTWTEPAPLTGESRSVFGQSLLRVGDHMLMVWHDTPGEPDRIYAISSSDSGVTWTAPVRIDHVPSEGPAASSPTVVLTPDGEALVAWQDARNGREDIFLARSTDWGRTWSKEDQRMDLDEPGTAMSRFPKLARASDGRIALVWEDDRVGHESVYLRIRSAGSKPEWGPERVVGAAGPKLAARLPDAVWAPGGLIVVWQAWDQTMGPSRGKRVSGQIVPVSR